MARLARSDVARDVMVPADASDEISPSAASVGSRGPAAARRLRPPRPRDGEVDDTSSDGPPPHVHDQLVDAAQESAALEASTADAEVVTSAAIVAAADVDVAGTAVQRPPLADRERAMLEFERFWWRHAGSKEQAIRETFGLSATHYYRLLNALLDRPAAVEFDPLVVGRLRRLRASRARRRAGR